VYLRSWKPLVMRLFLNWSTMACRRWGKNMLIHNLRGWRPQVPAALRWEWAVINRRVRGVGVGAVRNVVVIQRITSWAGSRIPRCFTSSMTSYGLNCSCLLLHNQLCTAVRLFLSPCVWYVGCGVQLFCDTLLIGICGACYMNIVNNCAWLPVGRPREYCRSLRPLPPPLPPNTKFYRLPSLLW
jgi:hypothetical protein